MLLLDILSLFFYVKHNVTEIKTVIAVIVLMRCFSENEPFILCLVVLKMVNSMFDLFQSWSSNPISNNTSWFCNINWNGTDHVSVSSINNNCLLTCLELEQIYVKEKKQGKNFLFVNVWLGSSASVFILVCHMSHCRYT